MLSRNWKLAAAIAFCIVPMLVHQSARAADMDSVKQLPLCSSERQKAEKQVVAELVGLSASQQNQQRAGGLLVVLAELCAQEGRNVEADFFYQMAIDTWKTVALHPDVR